jgi:hypothetical protein
MKLSTVTLLLVSAVTGLACNGGGGVVTPPDSSRGEFADLGTPKARLSGSVFDPEAFFYSLANFPPDPVPENNPPPALFAGIPFLIHSALPDTVVIAQSGTTLAAQSEPSLPTGEWQMTGLPVNGTTYEYLAQPPTSDIQLGEGLPSPPFAPIPLARYFPTRSLLPVVPNQTYCLSQVANAVGSKGALEGIAKFQSLGGPPVSVSDLLNPAKSGGVVLTWVYAPSPLLDLFLIPSGDARPMSRLGITMASNVGTVYALEWAPPGALPPELQSEMGYFVSDQGPSSLGYYAVVLPPGAASTQLHATFTDLVEDPEQGRPWTVPDVRATVYPGVSFRRHWAVMEGPPPDEDAEPGPAPDFKWLCQ